jgi:hypothetical protein
MWRIAEDAFSLPGKVLSSLQTHKEKAVSPLKVVAVLAVVGGVAYVAVKGGLPLDSFHLKRKEDIRGEEKRHKNIINDVVSCLLSEQLQPLYKLPKLDRKSLLNEVKTMCSEVILIVEGGSGTGKTTRKYKFQTK